MPESDRDKTIEVMARGIYSRNRASMATAMKAAQSALTALQASGMAVVPGWQPIESAPKDGTRIILAWGGAAVTGSYLDNSHTSYPWKGWRVPSLELTPPGAPSAWMPFPEVPAHVS